MYHASSRESLISSNIYRTDLLAKAGVEAIPETPDELYDALVKIKASGLVEWPIAIRGDHINRVFAPGFDSWGENEGIYVDNGVVKSGLIEHNRYDYLVFLNKLYTEGLLYSDYLTLDKKGMGNLILNSTTAQQLSDMLLAEVESEHGCLRCRRMTRPSQ